MMVMTTIMMIMMMMKPAFIMSKMVHQQLPYLLSLLWTYWHLKLIQGPSHFSVKFLEGVKRMILLEQWALAALSCSFYLISEGHDDMLLNATITK